MKLHIMTGFNDDLLNEYKRGWTDCLATLEAAKFTGAATHIKAVLNNADKEDESLRLLRTPNEPKLPPLLGNTDGELPL